MCCIYQLSFLFCSISKLFSCLCTNAMFCEYTGKLTISVEKFNNIFRDYTFAFEKFSNRQVGGMEVFGKDDADHIRMWIECIRSEHPNTSQYYTWFPHAYHWIVISFWACMDQHIKYTMRPYGVEAGQGHVETIMCQFLERSTLLEDVFTDLKNFEYGLSMSRVRTRIGAVPIPNSKQDIKEWGVEQMRILRRSRNKGSHEPISDLFPDFVDFLFLSLLLNVIVGERKTFDGHRRLFMQSLLQFFNVETDKNNDNQW